MALSKTGINDSCLFKVHIFHFQLSVIRVKRSKSVYKLNKTANATPDLYVMYLQNEMILDNILGHVVQSVTCLATDASLTADPGVESLILARSHTFVEINHEIISMVILLPSTESYKKGCCQLQAKVCAGSTG